MARKRVALSYIENDTNRKASFRKRSRGLINKVREISTLCGVDACAVIYSPHNPIPEVWPSPQRAREVLTRYFAVPEIDRSDKELNPVSFMLKRLRKTREKLERIRRENKRRDLNWFMYRCMARRDSLNHLDVRDCGEMGWVINQVIRDIRYNMEHFMPRGGGDALVAPPLAVVEEESRNTSMISLLMSPIEELDWDIGELQLPYPHLFNEWDREFKNNEN